MGLALERRRAHDKVMDELQAALRRKAAVELERQKGGATTIESFKLRYAPPATRHVHPEHPVTTRIVDTFMSAAQTVVNAYAGGSELRTNDPSVHVDPPVTMKLANQAAVIASAKLPPGTVTITDAPYVMRVPASSVAKDSPSGLVASKADANTTSTTASVASVSPSTVTKPAHRQPVSVQVREFFRNHPDRSFGIATIMIALRLPAEAGSVVRQAVQRLYDDSYLLREGRGIYRLNTAETP